MLDIGKAFRCAVVFLYPLVLLGCNAPWSSESSSDTSSRGSANDPLGEFKLLFDWNVQTDNFICSGIGANNNLISVGVSFSPTDIQLNTNAIDDLQGYVEDNFHGRIEVVGRENRLGILNLEMLECDALGALRALPAVEFVEAKYVSPISQEDVFDQALEMQFRASIQDANGEDAAMVDDAEEEPFNPGLYDPDMSEKSYVSHVRDIEERAADRIERHGLNRIYEEFGFYGAPTVGVAVVDNGVFDSEIDYLSQGRGDFTAEGYVRAFGAEESDGYQPQPYDLFGLLQFITNMYKHGTTQTKLVYTMAPHINIKSVRGAPFVFWFMPEQFQGAVDSILALAEDPTVKVISGSMGTIIHVHEIERAIEYFNAKDKLYFSAAGTTMPYLKEIVKVVFPASLSSTISATGIKSTIETGGEFVLGRDAHGGPETDFVVDHSDDSSQAVSTTAGMVGLLWSYNPSLTRAQMLEILVSSSSNYQRSGGKDPIFGWGKIDFYSAFLKVKSLSD